MSHKPAVARTKTTSQNVVLITKVKKQRVLFQIKGQDKTPKTQLNEMEIGNLPENEFRIMIVKMIQDLRKTMEARLRKCKKCLQRPRKTKEQTNRGE